MRFSLLRLREKPAIIWVIAVCCLCWSSAILGQAGEDCLVTEAGTDVLSRITSEGEREVIYSFSAGTKPAGVVVDTDGSYVVAEQWAHTLSRISPTGIRDIIYEFAAGTHPFGVALDCDGSYIVTENGTDKLSRITPDGAREVIYSFEAETDPAGVVVDSDGSYVVAESGDRVGADSLSRINEDPNTHEYVRTVIFAFDAETDPHDVDVEQDGSYMVVERSTDTLSRITPEGARVIICNFSPGTEPKGIAISQDGTAMTTGWAAGELMNGCATFYNFAPGTNPCGVAVEGGANKPNPPSCLSASGVSSDRINLTWVDNSDDEDGFKIERKPQGGSYSVIDTVAADTTGYSDAGLIADTYCYRVMAYNVAGNSGYSNEHCDATAVPSTYAGLYVMNMTDNTLAAANLAGTGGVPHGNCGGMINVPQGMVIDVGACKLYVVSAGATGSDDDSIIRMNLDGTGCENLGDLNGTLYDPTGIALDTTAGMMYVTNSTNDTISRANLDGTSGVSLGNLNGTLDEPHGIALDLVAGKMYVASYDGWTVSRANLGGTAGESLGNFNGLLADPDGVALDVAAGKLYVLNRRTDSVVRANLDGSCPEDLGDFNGTLDDPYALALDLSACKIYVANHGNDTVSRANLDGTEGTSLGDFDGNLSGPAGIALGPAQLIDTTPPSPDPMEWAMEPHATGPDTIAMTATTTTDPSGVEYHFEETTGNPGGDNSGWQDNREYTDMGLNPKTQYCYRVRARDKSANANETGWSTVECSSTSIHGDINGDGVVSLVDVLMLYRYVAGTLELTPGELARADVDEDGNVDEDDLEALVHLVFGP
jgi:DNA-binding beta-propeller fold protein YncE